MVAKIVSFERATSKVITRQICRDIRMAFFRVWRDAETGVKNALTSSGAEIRAECKFLEYGSVGRTIFYINTFGYSQIGNSSRSEGISR